MKEMRRKYKHEGRMKNTEAFTTIYNMKKMNRVEFCKLLHQIERDRIKCKCIKYIFTGNSNKYKIPAKSIIGNPFYITKQLIKDVKEKNDIEYIIRLKDSYANKYIYQALTKEQFDIVMGSIQRPVKPVRPVKPTKPIKPHNGDNKSKNHPKEKVLNNRVVKGENTR